MIKIEWIRARSVCPKVEKGIVKLASPFLALPSCGIPAA